MLTTMACNIMASSTTVILLGKMYSIKAITGLFDDALYLCDQLNEFKDYIDDKSLNQIFKDREIIEKRRNSENKKVNLIIMQIIGDDFFKDEKIDHAETIYREILEDFPDNEKVLSNLSLIALQRLEFDKSLNLCTKILKIT